MTSFPLCPLEESFTLPQDGTGVDTRAPRDSTEEKYPWSVLVIKPVTFIIMLIT